VSVSHRSYFFLIAANVSFFFGAVPASSAVSPAGSTRLAKKKPFNCQQKKAAKI